MCDEMNIKSKPAATIIIEPDTCAQYAMIYCHGLGENGQEFIPIAQKLHELTKLPIRFIVPQADLVQMTIANGKPTRAWFDIFDRGPNAQEDHLGLENTTHKIYQWIEEQLFSGIDSKKVFLAGFSQGAAAILHSSLRFSQSLAGLAVFSGYLTSHQTLHQEKSRANQDTPIFWSHGLKDMIIPYRWAEQCTELLKQENYDIQLYPSHSNHGITNEQIKLFANWLVRLLML